MKILIRKTACSELLCRHNSSVTVDRFRPEFLEKIEKFQGQWLTVETEFLFEDQFNVVEGNLRIMHDIVEDIDFEEMTYDEWRQKVVERYAIDWPDRKVSTYHVDRILFKAGKRKKDPAREIEEKRGYDIYGRSI